MVTSRPPSSQEQPGSRRLLSHLLEQEAAAALVALIRGSELYWSGVWQNHWGY